MLTKQTNKTLILGSELPFHIWRLVLDQKLGLSDISSGGAMEAMDFSAIIMKHTLCCVR